MVHFPNRYGGLLAGLLLFIAHFFWAWEGFFGYDDIQYARLAAHSLENQFYFDQDHFAWRLGIWYPLALLYQIFGVEDWSTRLWPLLASLSTLLLLHRQLPKESTRLVLILLVGLYAGNAYVLLFAINLYPDAIVACLGLALVLCSMQGRLDKPGRQLYWGLGAALCLFWALMTKLSILLFLPLGIFWAIQDLLSKKNELFWLAFLGALTLFVGLLEGFSGYGGLNSFTRLELISQSEYPNACQYSQESWSPLFARLTWEPGQMFIQSGLLLPLLFALGTWPGLFPNLKPKQHERLWAQAFWWLLASYYFFPSSWSAYRPLCLEARHFLPLIPLAILAGVPVARAYFVEQKRSAFILVVLLLTSLYGWIFPYGKLHYIYTALALLAGVHYGGGFTQAPISYLAIWLSVLLIHPLYGLIKPKPQVHKEMQIFVGKYGKILQAADYILSDSRSTASADYYFKFSSSCPQFLGPEEYKSLSGLEPKRVLWLYNAAYVRDLEENYGVVNSWNPSCISDTLPPLYQSPHLKLYDISWTEGKKISCESP